MTSAAQMGTLSTGLDEPDDGIVTYSFGGPLSKTSAIPRAPATQDSEVRRIIQVEKPARVARTTTRHLTAEEYFKPIKNWEGVVESVSDKSLTATMRDADNPADRGEEQFEIDLADVEPGDRDLVLPGGIFYFTVGYRILRKGGTRVKGAQIVFRRMPLWSKQDIQRTNARANRLLSIMTGGNALERSD